MDKTVPPNAFARGSGSLTGWLETIAYIPEEPEAPGPGPTPEPDPDVVSNDLADNRPSTPDRAGDVLARTKRVAVVRLPAYRERLGELAAHDLAWRARAQHARRMGPRLEKHLAPEWRVQRLQSASSGRRVRVMPCLVIVTGSAHPDIVVQDDIEGVLALDSSTVVRTFRSLEPVLTPDDVEAVFDAARRRASWVIGGV